MAKLPERNDFMKKLYSILADYEIDSVIESAELSTDNLLCDVAEIKTKGVLIGLSVGIIFAGLACLSAHMACVKNKKEDKNNG